MNLLEILVKKNLIREGVEDPAKLKAVFMAGGPGSGKGFVSKNLFNIPSDLPLSSYGLKVINSDHEFEFLLKKENISLDLSKLSPEEFKKLTSGPTSLRSKAKELSSKKFKMFRNSRLGLLIDGTGDTIEGIQHKKYLLSTLGYDTYMIFVNTSLDVALQRNRSRQRKLPDSLVKEIWTSCQNNLKHFKNIFGTNFIIVDNSSPGVNHKDVIRSIIKFINSPIQNPLGRNWIQNYYNIKSMSTETPPSDANYDGDGDESEFNIKRDPMSSRSLVSKKIEK